ncbi:hypothetical protein ACSSS7_004692 [Eimeria intestinalis]
MAGGLRSGRWICGRRVRAVLGALVLALLVVLSESARGSEESSALQAPAEAEVAAADGVSMEEEPLHTAADTAVGTTTRHPNTLVGRPHQSRMMGRYAGALLLLASILAVYGVARWTQAGRVAADASAAAAARIQALQGTLAQYEARSQLAEQLSKQLAEKRAGTSQFQAEVETAAKQTEEKEKELIAELMQHASQGVDTGALVKALAEEAKTLEAEAEELRRQLQASARPAPEGTLLALAHEEQAALEAKRRELLQKKARKAAAEARWEGQFKSEREELWAMTAKNLHELRAVEQRKLQMRAKIIDNVKRALAATSDPNLKESLLQRLTALKLEVAERQTTGQKAGGTDAAEKQRQLEQLRLDVEKSREEEKRLADLLEKKQQAFLEKLAPLEEGIDKLGKKPVCLGRRRKHDDLAILNKRDERTCKGLVRETVEEHKRLEELTRLFAVSLQQLKVGKMENEIRELEEEAAEAGRTEEEKTFLQLRVKQLQEDIASLVPKTCAEAKGAEKDLMIMLEMRDVVRYNTALHAAAALQQQLEEDPQNKELQDKVLRLHVAYERARLSMMMDLDLALGIYNQKAHGPEVFGLFYERKGLDALKEREIKRLMDLSAECRERFELTAKRRVFLRKQLLLYRRKSLEERASQGITSSLILEAKMQLVTEASQLRYYAARRKTLERALEDVLEGGYEDKLAEAKEKWRESRQLYPSVSARRLALGGDKESFDSESFSQRNLAALEEYLSETEEDAEAEARLKDVPDDEGVSDEQLLGLSDTKELTLHEVFSEDEQVGGGTSADSDSTASDSGADRQPSQMMRDKLRALDDDDVSPSDDEEGDGGESENGSGGEEESEEESNSGNPGEVEKEEEEEEEEKGTTGSEASPRAQEVLATGETEKSEHPAERDETTTKKSAEAQQQAAPPAGQDSPGTKKTDEDKDTGGDEEGGEESEPSNGEKKPSLDDTPEQTQQDPQGSTPLQDEADQGTEGEAPQSGDGSQGGQSSEESGGDEENSEHREGEPQRAASQPGDDGQTGSISENPGSGQQNPSPQTESTEEQGTASQHEKNDEQGFS